MGSAIRFSGLVSGMDTESIVKAMLTNQQSKIDKINKNTTMAEWKKDAYKEMSLKINKFKSESLSKLKATNFNKPKTTMSQEGAIKVTADSSTTEGTHKIEVESVAKKATVSTKTIKSESGTKLTKSSLITDIKDMPRSGSIGICGVEVAFDETMTIEGFQNAVKEKLTDMGKDVSFKFDESAGAFIINSNETGKDQSITLEDGGTGILAAMGVQEVNGGYTYEGTNAKVIYNDGVTIESESNDIEINGLKFTAVTQTSQPVTVSISKDIDTMVNSIKSFVQDYNDLLSEMNSMLNADSAKSYEPLTDEEKEAMTDKQVEQWEEKIKGAILRKDSGLSDLTSLFRTTMSTDYASQGLNKNCSMLSHIGIGSTNWSDRGKLTVNEEKLKKALTENGDDAVKLITTIANKLESELVKRSTSTELRSYNQYFSDKTLTSNISKYKTELERAQKRYDSAETALYKKFTAMETAMNNMNSQSSLFSLL
ncbi:flagellar filament capping protein FliD [Cellulosilyticum ruminicola]|uniref:flagellar filament capping protein FliD n=1 Tax=Cellulosilyticum ruminicola TaxID=425254 RepID=UPI0006D1D0BD|nr:flagellar filament capping protein FliD [Cellulosilyticum ruminicola]